MMKLIGEWWALLGRAFVPVFVSVTVLSLPLQLITQLHENGLPSRSASFAITLGMFMWTAAVCAFAVHACLNSISGRMMLGRSLGVLLRRVPKIISATLLLLGVLFAVSFVVVLFIGGTDLLGVGSRLQRLAMFAGLILSLVLVAARYLLLPAVLMVEGLGGWAALSRSARLVRSRQLYAIGLMALFAVSSYAAMTILNLLAVAGPARAVAGHVVSGIWGTLFAAAVAVLYVRACVSEAEAERSAEAARADQPADA